MVNFLAHNLIRRLEEISQDKQDKVLILNGTVINDIGKKEFLEILVFRGFSSCTTHPTDYDLNKTTLPKNAKIETATLLKGPLNLEQKEIIRGPEKINKFLKEESWN